jgi:hypothetical protein
VIILAHGVSLQGERVGLGQGATPRVFLGWRKKIIMKGEDDEEDI